MYKTIVVHVDQTERAAQRIDVAARLANKYEAHLYGLRRIISIIRGSENE